MKAKITHAAGCLALALPLALHAQETGLEPKEPEIVPLPIEKLTRTEPVDFAKEIYPILKKNCIACHSQSESKADLVLESPEDIRKGSENGEVIVAGDPDNSVLFLTSAHIEEPIMPPEKNKANAKNLTPQELALLKLWIEQGAKGEGPAKIEKPLVWRPLPGGVRPVYAVSLSPDGRHIAVGRGNWVEIFGASNGQLVAKIEDPELKTGGAHRDLINSISFGYDWIATGGFKEVKLWKGERAGPASEVNLGADVELLVASPDGAFRAARLKGGQIAWWPAAKPGEKKTIKVQGTATALTVSSDGSLGVASDDKKIRIYPPAGGNPAWEAEAPEVVSSLAFCGDGQIAGVCGDPVVRIWKVLDAKAAPQELKGHTKPVQKLVSNGGLLVSAAEGGEMKTWKMPAGSAGATATAGGEISSLAVAEDGSHFAVSLPDGNAKLFGADGKEIAISKVLASVDYSAKKASRALTVNKNLVATRKTQRDAAQKKRDEEAKKPPITKEEFTKAETERKAKEGPEKATADALKQAKDELAAAEAKGTEALKPLQDQVTKAEEVAKAAPEKAKAEADAKVAEAKKTLTDAEEKGRAELKPLQDNVKNAEQALAATAADAKAPKEAELKKVKDALAAAEAKNTAALKPLQDKVKAEETAAKTVPEKAKAAADAEIKKAKDALVAAENKGKNDRKALEDKVKKAEDAAKKAADEAESARKAESAAKFNMESAIRIAAREEEALKVAEEKLKNAEAAAKQAEIDDAEAKKLLAAPLEGKVTMVGFVGGHLTMVLEDGKMRVWGIGDQVGLDELPAVDGGAPGLVAGNHVLFTKGGGEVIALSPINQWSLAKVLETGGDRVTSVDLSPDGKLVAVGTGEPSRSGALSLWELGSGKKLWEEVDAHTDLVASLEFSPDGQHIATCAADRMAKVFSVADGKLIRTFEGHTGYVTGIAWRADGLQFSTAGADHEIKVWEFETGDQKKTVKGHNKEVTAVSYLGTADTVVSSSGDGSVRINNAPLPSSSGFVQCVDIDPGGRWVVSGTADGVVRIWSANDKKLAHELK